MTLVRVHRMGGGLIHSSWVERYDKANDLYLLPGPDGEASVPALYRRHPLIEAWEKDQTTGRAE